MIRPRASFGAAVRDRLPVGRGRLGLLAGIAWLGISLAVLAGAWPSAHWDAFAAMMVAGGTLLAFVAARASQASSEAAQRSIEALTSTTQPALDVGVVGRDWGWSGLETGTLAVRVQNVSAINEARGLVVHAVRADGTPYTYEHDFLPPGGVVDFDVGPGVGNDIVVPAGAFEQIAVEFGDAFGFGRYRVERRRPDWHLEARRLSGAR